ncbi:MAG: hypothetical protein IT303_05765 [Dehalococcoidia bacterium]|nr:hypothetical protein [Dehalococcoidia bacterium]
MNSNATEELDTCGPDGHPRVGDDVLLFRGVRLGAVRMIAQGAFQVATGDLLVWIRNEAILARTHHGVRLLCDRDNLHLYAGRGTAAAPAPGGFRTPAVVA